MDRYEVALLSNDEVNMVIISLYRLIRDIKSSDFSHPIIDEKIDNLQNLIKKLETYKEES